MLPSEGIYTGEWLTKKSRDPGFQDKKKSRDPGFRRAKIKAGIQGSEGPQKKQGSRVPAKKNSYVARGKKKAGIRGSEGPYKKSGIQGSERQK